MKKLFFVLLICFVVNCFSFAAAQLKDDIALAAENSGTCGENLTWTLDSSGTLTISGTGEMYNYEYDESPWGNNYIIKKVVIKSGVTSVGNYAFDGDVNLTNITFPNTLKNIGFSAFKSSRVISVNIPSSVTSIDSTAFILCFELENIYVDEKNAQYCSEDGVLFDKEKTTLITYPAGKTDKIYRVPNGVTKIGYCGFIRCHRLNRVILPHGITSIGMEAFSSCTNLTTINIPDGVTNIEFHTFWDCGDLTSIAIPNSVTSIDHGAFLMGRSLTDVYYGGSEEQWNNVEIGWGNEDLLNASIHYNTMRGISVSALDSYTTTKFNVTACNIPENSVIILALYNGNRLTDMQLTVYQNDSITFTSDNKYTSAKVMAWEDPDTMMPVCKTEFSDIHFVDATIIVDEIDKIKEEVIGE